QRVIVDLILEALKQISVFALDTAARVCMFKRIPVLILQSPDFAAIEIRKGQQRVRAKRLLACLVGQMFRDLAPGTCERMDGHRIAVFKKQRERGAELSPRDFNFVELHCPSEAPRMATRIPPPSPLPPRASPPVPPGS